jgi:LacI family transcriptional regulator
MRDVARRAGVSTATVSRVISNNGYVSAETRRRVDRAIKDLAYVPNALARGLKTQRSGIVALLIPEIVNSFYTTVCRGAEDVANAAGFQVLVGNTDEDVAKERAYVELMTSSQVDGFIVACAGHSARSLRPLTTLQIPTVLIDRKVDGFAGDIVHGDNVAGMIQLTHHLIALGHRRIAFVNGNLETSVARDRETGFRHALIEAGIAVAEDLISAGTWFIDDAETRVSTLLDRRRSLSAIVAANNFMAIGALRALRRRGIQVPETVAIVCYDDIEVAAEIDPFLTVMAQPAYTMGTLAMQLLLERIGGKYNGPPRQVVLAPRLLVRRSCGAQLPIGLISRNGNTQAEPIVTASDGERRQTALTD